MSIGFESELNISGNVTIITTPEPSMERNHGTATRPEREPAIELESGPMERVPETTMELELGPSNSSHVPGPSVDPEPGPAKEPEHETFRPLAASTPKAKSGGGHLCPSCGKGYKYAKGLTEHMRMAHDYQNGPRFRCDEKNCNSVFMNVTSFDAHMNMHKDQKPHECAHCKKTYAGKRSLQRHVCKLTAQFSCNECMKRFKSKATLKQHANTHDEAGQFCCKRCNKNFKHRSSLKRHEKLRCIITRMHRLA